MSISAANEPKPEIPFLLCLKIYESDRYAVRQRLLDRIKEVPKHLLKLIFRSCVKHSSALYPFGEKKRIFGV